MIALLFSIEPGAARPADAPTASGRSILFVENAGQWPDAARFQVWVSPAGVGTTWLARDAIWVLVAGGPEVRGSEISKSEDQRSVRRSDPTSDLRPLTSVKLTFPGSNPDVRIEPLKPLTATVSYFIGNDPDQWRPAVPVWGGVRYIDLYPGVDLVLGEEASFWRFEATADAATAHVVMQVEGAELDSLAPRGPGLTWDDQTLPVALPQAPFAYRVVGTIRNQTRAFHVQPTIALFPSFQAAGDPADLIYSTFLAGNSGCEHGIGLDGAGQATVGGWTSSMTFPTTPGAFDPTYNGGAYGDAFVARLSVDGSRLVYGTFLGGSDSEYIYALAVDGSGQATVTGYTGSRDFPTTPGAYALVYHGGYGDAFVTRLSTDGSRLVFSTFLGSTGSEYGTAIAVDETGRATVGGNTPSETFPTTYGVFDSSYNGGWDGFITWLSADGRTLLYSTFLGGSAADGVAAIALDGDGQATITGHTSSGDFPTTSGAVDPSLDGAEDAFVARLNASGSALDFSTFLGGSSYDLGTGVAIAGSGQAVVTGNTDSSDFPVTPAAYDILFDGGRDAFLTQLATDGSALVYSTYLGGRRDDSASAVALDNQGRATVSGATSSADFPTSPGAYDTTLNDTQGDAYVARLSADGRRLVYGTFLGGNAYDGACALALDASGRASVAGWTGSSDFPTTSGAFDPTFDGPWDVFVSRLDLTPQAPDVIAPIEQPRAGALVSGLVTLSGFAIDLSSSTGTGIDMVRITWSNPGGTGNMIGQAAYGLHRPDIAAQYGERFGFSGWELAWDTSTLTPDVYQLHLYAHRTADNAWSQLPPHPVVVRAGHVYWLPVTSRNS